VGTRAGSSIVVALVVALVGLVFVAQGLGAPIGHSFMIGDLRWTAIGAAMIAGAGLWAWRRGGQRPSS
jgi:protein-S-isoprenylcysteine O-methyltransferase Ste14